MSKNRRRLGLERKGKLFFQGDSRRRVLAASRHASIQLLLKPPEQFSEVKTVLVTKRLIWLCYDRGQQSKLFFPKRGESKHE
jgi:hypothetical protein